MLHCFQSGKLPRFLYPLSLPRCSMLGTAGPQHLWLPRAAKHCTSWEWGWRQLSALQACEGLWRVGPASPWTEVSAAEGRSVLVLVLKPSGILEQLLAQLNSNLDQPGFWRLLESWKEITDFAKLGTDLFLLFVMHVFKQSEYSLPPLHHFLETVGKSRAADCHGQSSLCKSSLMGQKLQMGFPLRGSPQASVILSTLGPTWWQSQKGGTHNAFDRPFTNSCSSQGGFLASTCAVIYQD